MPSTIIPACTLCGLRFSNGALLDLHIREDHLERNRVPQSDHYASDHPDLPDARGSKPSSGNGLASGEPRTDEMTTMTTAQRPRPGRAMNTLRQVIGALRHVNHELARASEAMIRSARAPQPGPQPGESASKDAQVASSAERGNRFA